MTRFEPDLRTPAPTSLPPCVGGAGGRPPGATVAAAQQALLEPGTAEMLA